MTVAAATTETVYALALANLGPFSTVWPYDVAASVTALLNRQDGNGWVALAQGVDYALTGLTPLTNGGTALLSVNLLDGAAAWPAGTSLCLKRATASGQPNAFGEVLGFSPASAETADDNLSRQIQDLQTDQARAIAAPFGEAPALLPPKATRANTYAAFNANGDLVSAAPVPNLVAEAFNDIDWSQVSDAALIGLAEAMPAAGATALFEAMQAAGCFAAFAGN